MKGREKRTRAGILSGRNPGAATRIPIRLSVVFVVVVGRPTRRVWSEAVIGIVVLTPTGIGI